MTITKRDCVNKMRNIDKTKIDYAIPRTFIDNCQRVTNENPTAHFVWYYKHDKIFGEPLPITNIGQHILELYKHRTGETS